MPIKLNIKQFFYVLNQGKEVIDTLFGKKNTLQKNEILPNILNKNPEKIFEKLIIHGIIHEKNDKINLDDRIISLLEDYLEIGEINTDTIIGDINTLKKNIEYYRNDKQIKYLKIIRKILTKINNTITRQIILLDNQVDKTFKTEQNYNNRLKKLENYREERNNILKLIKDTEKFLENEKGFFNNVRDDEIQFLQKELKKTLYDNKDYLIAIQSQIIDYINRIKINPKIVDKLNKLKALKDNAELRFKTNIKDVVQKNNSLLFQKQETFKWQVPINFLTDTDTGRRILLKVRKKVKKNSKENIDKKPTIKRIKPPTKRKIEIKRLNIDKYFKKFEKSKIDLFNFIFDSKLPKDVPQNIDDRLSYFVKISIDYEKKISLKKEIKYYKYKDENGKTNKIGYAVIFPKNKKI